MMDGVVSVYQDPQHHWIADTGGDKVSPGPEAERHDFRTWAEAMATASEITAAWRADESLIGRSVRFQIARRHYHPSAS